MCCMCCGCICCMCCCSAETVGPCAVACATVSLASVASATCDAAPCGTTASVVKPPTSSCRLPLLQWKALPSLPLAALSCDAVVPAALSTRPRPPGGPPSTRSSSDGCDSSGLYIASTSPTWKRSAYAVCSPHRCRHRSSVLRAPTLTSTHCVFAVAGCESAPPRLRRPSTTSWCRTRGAAPPSLQVGLRTCSTFALRPKAGARSASAGSKAFM